MLAIFFQYKSLIRRCCCSLAISKKPWRTRH